MILANNAMLGGHVGRLIMALAIDDEDLVGLRQGRQAAPQVLGLVLGEDQDVLVDDLGGSVSEESASQGAGF